MNLWIEVDKVLWIKPMDFSRLKPEKSGGWWLAVGGRDPPAAGLAGVTVAALNTYKKNFLKNLLH